MDLVRLIGQTTFTACLRDRLLHVIFGVAVFLFLLVPSLSLFSMRQVQELSISLSLSAISALLLIVAALLGSSSIWREVEKRYLLSVLGLPVSRGSYVLGKFLGIAAFILLCGVLLALVASLAIAVASAQYSSDLPLRWENVILAIAGDTLKCIILAAIALLVSCVSTSFYLPFFVTIVIYLAGSASQEVYEYVHGDYGSSISGVAKGLVKLVYFLLPNLSAFDFKVFAIYSIQPDLKGIGFALLYFLLYTAISLVLAVWVFNRREFA